MAINFLSLRCHLLLCINSKLNQTKKVHVIFATLFVLAKVIPNRMVLSLAIFHKLQFPRELAAEHAINGNHRQPFRIGFCRWFRPNKRELNGENKMWRPAGKGCAFAKERDIRILGVIWFQTVYHFVIHSLFFLNKENEMNFGRKNAK